MQNNYSIVIIKKSRNSYYVLMIDKKLKWNYISYNSIFHLKKLIISCIMPFEVSISTGE